MALEIVKTFEVNAAPDAVWSFLTNLPRVARCLPGAAIGDKLDEKTSSGTMTIKVGPVSSTYRGKVVFERLDPTARTAEIVATGQDVRGKGGADLKLTSSLKALPGGKTEVTAVSLVNVTGMLAQMGRGMIQDVSDEMFQNLLRADARGAGVAPSRSAVANPVTDGAGAPAAEALSGAGAPTLSPSPGARAGPAEPEALDAAALGARVARRSAARLVKQPAFWVVLLLARGGARLSVAAEVVVRSVGGTMIPASFDYHAPGTLPEALALLTRYGDDAKVLSGGQSLLPLLKLRLGQTGPPDRHQAHPRPRVHPRGGWLAPHRRPARASRRSRRPRSSGAAIRSCTTRRR